MNETNKNIFHENNILAENFDEYSNLSIETEDFSSLKFSPESLTGNLGPFKKDPIKTKRLRSNSEDQEKFQFLITKKTIGMTRKEKIKKIMKYLRQIVEEEIKITKKFSFK